MSPVSYQLLYPAIENGGERGIRTPAAVTPCRFSRPIPSARLGYFSVYICWYLIGGPCRTRTYDRPVMSRMLWPTELRVHVSHEIKMVAAEGLEPPTSRVWTERYSQLSYTAVLRFYTKNGGSNGARTHGLLRAKQALSQLSYGPTIKIIGA